MPEEIIVASWRERTVSSAGLDPLGREAELHLEPALLLLERHDLQAAALELGVTVFLSDAVGPICGMPERSTALNA